MGGESDRVDRAEAPAAIEILPADVPITMPELPLRLTIATPGQLKALGDATRARILAIVQHQPATAKQIADRLGVPPGTIGHHLQVLETAGLVQIVARRLIRGVVAKYYTRTARIFVYGSASESSGAEASDLAILTQARGELAEALTSIAEDPYRSAGLLRARLAPERVEEYRARITALIDDFLGEKSDPAGRIYDLSIAMFEAPPYLQVGDVRSASEAA